MTAYTDPVFEFSVLFLHCAPPYKIRDRKYASSLSSTQPNAGYRQNRLRVDTAQGNVPHLHALRSRRFPPAKDTEKNDECVLAAVCNKSAIPIPFQAEQSEISRPYYTYMSVSVMSAWRGSSSTIKRTRRLVSKAIIGCVSGTLPNRSCNPPVCRVRRWESPVPGT